jgi:hypothetical protein
LKDIALVVDITRLKGQEGGFTRIDARAIEREALRRPHECDVRLDVVKGPRRIPEVLSLEEYDGEIARHGFQPP